MLLTRTLRKSEKKGVDAFSVYDDGWQIWTGFYVDENGAQAAITDYVERL